MSYATTRSASAANGPIYCTVQFHDDADETGNNLVTMGAGGGQWFEDVLYLNSGGQGIMRKKMED